MSQLAENIIRKWWTSTLPEILPRNVDLMQYYNLPVRKIISVVGFRRVGKTYIFLDFLGERDRFSA